MQYHSPKLLDERYQVSIPNRDFDELQSQMLNEVGISALVSIPNRDFDELQLLLVMDAQRNLTVSIPNRDFDELQSFYFFKNEWAI